MEEFIPTNQIAQEKRKQFFRKENIVFFALFIVFFAFATFFLYRNFIPAFATGTFMSDFLTIDAAEGTDAATASQWVAINGTFLKNFKYSTDLQQQGNSSIGWQGSTAGTGSGLYQNFSPALNLENKQLWIYLYLGVATEGPVRDMISNFGLELNQNATRGGLRNTWIICTTNANCKTKLNSGWTSLRVYTTQPTTDGGLDTSSVASLALVFDHSSKFTPKAGPASAMAFDFLRAGKEISFTGGSAASPVTFQDVKDFSDTQSLDAIAITGNAIDLRVSLNIGATTTPGTATFFKDTDRYIGMSMANSDDKLSFFLWPNSTTTFGTLENGFAISGNTVAYLGDEVLSKIQATSSLRSIPFIFNSSETPLPELYLYASAIKQSEDVFFGTSTSAAIGRGQIYDTEIDNASTTFIYSSGVASDGLEFKNVDIHHSTSSATSTAKIFITPNKEYENIRIFASPTNALDIATTTGGPDQITLKNITLSNNKGYDIRIENPYVVNMINSSFVNASTTYLNVAHGWILNKQYTFDVTVQSGGQAVSGASVTLTGGNGEAFSVLTGEDGKITQQIVTAFQITHATGTSAVSVNDFNSFTLDVTATGLNPFSQTLTVGAAQDLTAVLSSACTSSGADKAYPISVSTSSDSSFIPTITILGAKSRNN